MIENKKRNNLKKQAEWFNPYLAITDKNTAYELSNIIIYNDEGILIDTGHGWLESTGDNRIGDRYIGAIKRKMKEDFSKNENFIIKDKSINFENRYILYIYYKNINYNFINISLGDHLEINYTVFDNIKLEKVIGSRDNKSTDFLYNDETLKEIEKEGQNLSYYIKYKTEKTLEKIEDLKKAIKKYKKIVDDEKLLTVKDYKKIIYNDYFLKQLKNNMKMKGCENNEIN